MGKEQLFANYPAKYQKLIRIPEGMEKEFYRLKERYDIAYKFFELAQKELVEFIEECEKE